MTFIPSRETLQAGERLLSGPRPAISGPYELAFRSFLRSEEDATARLMLFYQQARLEIGDYIGNLLGQVPQPDLEHYRQLQAGLDGILGELDAGAAKWADESAASAYAAGKGLSGAPDFTTIHDEAVKALARGQLDLITNTSNDVRRSIQQEVSQALIGSIRGPELVARIMGTGLAPGPWKTLEERAGVIARTETMRAFNAGNMAGITESGAYLVRWITSEDEAVCKVCGPRDGEVYRITSTIDADALNADERSFLLGLSFLDSVGGAPPAHPRCRCTIAAHFRGPGGAVLGDPGAEVAAREAAKVDDADLAAAIAGERPSRTFDSELGRLTTGAWRNDPEALAFWRKHGALTEAQLRAVADSGMGGFAEFMQARYGVKVFEYGGRIVRGRHKYTQARSPQYSFLAKNAELRRLALEAFEEFHRIGAARYVNALEEGIDGNVYLRIFAPSGQGSNVLASCSSDGWIMWDVKKMLPYLKGQTLRAGDEVNGVKEVLIHEIGHSIHNRFGANGRLISSELADTDARNAFWSAWNSIRSSTGKYTAGWKHGAQNVRGPGSGNAELTGLKLRYEANVKTIAKADRLSLDPEHAAAEYRAFADRMRQLGATNFETYDDWLARMIRQGENAANELPTLKAKVAELERLTDEPIETFGEHWPTEYGRESWQEDFAESVSLYMLNPERLRLYSPLRYAFLRDRVFMGAGG